jgi:hypothetical protein
MTVGWRKRPLRRRVVSLRTSKRLFIVDSETSSVRSITTVTRWPSADACGNGFV